MFFFCEFYEWKFAYFLPEEVFPLVGHVCPVVHILDGSSEFDVHVIESIWKFDLWHLVKPQEKSSSPPLVVRPLREGGGGAGYWDNRIFFESQKIWDRFQHDLFLPQRVFWVTFLYTVENIFISILKLSNYIKYRIIFIVSLTEKWNILKHIPNGGWGTLPLSQTKNNSNILEVI